MSEVERGNNVNGKARDGFGVRLSDAGIGTQSMHKNIRGKSR